MWLQNQESFSFHKPICREFKRLRVIVGSLHDQNLNEKNDGVRFLLIIDVFSQHLWVETLLNKTEDSIIEAFQCIFQRTSKPKSSLWNYMRKVQRCRYVDVLQDMVKSYNDTLHQTISMKPSEVTKGHVQRRLWWHQYKPKESYERFKQLHKVLFAFKKGNHVCISHKAQTFQWGHDEKWTTEIFEVYQPFMHLGVHKYCLHNLQGEDLKGTFYKAELQHITYSPNQTFEVKRELNCRG